MKKTLMFLLLVASLGMASHNAFAQEITITLSPGLTLISYPNAEVMDIATALGDFVPNEGDMIKSQNISCSYLNGSWRGELTHFVPGLGYKYYSTRTENVELVFARPSSFSLVTDVPTEIASALVRMSGTVTIIGEGNYIFLRGMCYGTEPNPDLVGAHTSNGSGTGSFSATLEGLTPNTTYYARAYAVSNYGLSYGNEVNFTTLGEPEYVDLGLPSGNIWATCNIGANSPAEYGHYFAWGETQPKEYYDFSNYQHCDGDPGSSTKYIINLGIWGCFFYSVSPDNLTTLLPEDDAASAYCGNAWHMPSQEDWEELFENTTNVYTSQNGVNGRLFTAFNGNSFFLPSAGYKLESSLNYVGDWGFYWSNDFSSYPVFSNCLNFGSGTDPQLSTNYRPAGCSVRPLRSGYPVRGKFTINDNGDQVYFSPGNLQYQASTNTWRFAEHQYDYVGGTIPGGGTFGNVSGSSNNSISSTYDGWIDLFGWGTSGYDHGANCYQPWSTSETSRDYYAYGSDTYNLYDQTGQADWGYNQISNAGNQLNQWRTLTQSEWDYVFNTRDTPSGIRYAMANVNDVNGIILLPDSWTSYITLNDTNNSEAAFSSNTITEEQWSALEKRGAIFLPAAGYRYNGTWVYIVGSGGRYWSASYRESYNAFGVSYGSSGELNTGYYISRFYGQSVRLVAPVGD